VPNHTSRRVGGSIASIEFFAFMRGRPFVSSKDAGIQQKSAITLHYYMQPFSIHGISSLVMLLATAASCNTVTRSDN
jgi:hypothetical protein